MSVSVEKDLILTCQILGHIIIRHIQELVTLGQTGKSVHGDIIDLPVSCQRSKKIKIGETISNGESNYVNLFGMDVDRHPKVSMVTSLSDLLLRGQRSKKIKI